MLLVLAVVDRHPQVVLHVHLPLMLVCRDRETPAINTLNPKSPSLGILLDVYSVSKGKTKSICRNKEG